MASSFPLSIATRAATQRNNAGPVGSTIENPIEIIESSYDLDSDDSDSPYFRPPTNKNTTKQEVGTTAVFAPAFDQGTEPPSWTDQELTEYPEDPAPSFAGVKHAYESKTPSPTPLPPTAGGNTIAMQYNPLTTLYEYATTMNHVPLTIEPPSPSIPSEPLSLFHPLHPCTEMPCGDLPPPLGSL